MPQDAIRVSSFFKFFEAFIFLDTFLSEISSKIKWSAMHVEEAHFDLALDTFLPILHE